MGLLGYRSAALGMKGEKEMTNLEKFKEVMRDVFGIEVDAKHTREYVFPPAHYYCTGFGLDGKNRREWWDDEYMPPERRPCGKSAMECVFGGTSESETRGAGKAKEGASEREGPFVAGHEKVAFDRIGKLADVIKVYAEDGYCDGIDRFSYEMLAQCSLIEIMEKKGH